MDNGACRWQQRSSSATGTPSSRRNSTTGWLSRMRRRRSRVTSWSQAATYHALRTNIGGLLAVAKLVEHQYDPEHPACDVNAKHESRRLVWREHHKARYGERHPQHCRQDPGEVAHHRGADEPDAEKRAQRYHGDVP